MGADQHVAFPVSRRRFLGLSAVAAAAPTTLSQTSQSSTDPTVVIGAGLAGLRAADLLRRAGRPVVVLEARERAGGRVLTVRSPFDDGLHAEAGPIRISGAHRSVLQLIRSLGLTLVPFESSIGSPSSASREWLIAPASARAELASEMNPDERGLSPLELLERTWGRSERPGRTNHDCRVVLQKWAEYDRLSWPAWLRFRGASPGAVRIDDARRLAEDVSARPC